VSFCPLSSRLRLLFSQPPRHLLPIAQARRLSRRFAGVAPLRADLPSFLEVRSSAFISLFLPFRRFSVVSAVCSRYFVVLSMGGFRWVSLALSTRGPSLTFFRFRVSQVCVFPEIERRSVSPQRFKELGGLWAPPPTKTQGGHTRILQRGKQRSSSQSRLLCIVTIRACFARPAFLTQTFISDCVSIDYSWFSVFRFCFPFRNGASSKHSRLFGANSSQNRFPLTTRINLRCAYITFFQPSTLRLAQLRLPRGSPFSCVFHDPCASRYPRFAVVEINRVYSLLFFAMLSIAYDARLAPLWGHLGPATRGRTSAHF